MTQNLSALLVLAQDETFNDEARQESSAERHARRQAVERFIFSQLDIIEPRIKQLEQLERDAATEGKTVDSYIEKLRNTLQQLEQQRRKPLMKMRNSLNTSAHCIRKTSVWTYCSPSVKPY